MRLDDIKPSDEELRVVLEAGYVLREAGRFDDAEKIFRGMIEMLPVSDVPRVALGTVALQRGRVGDALTLCEGALGVQPSSLYARVHHAEALLFGGEREKAEAELHEVIAIDPNSPHTSTARALLEAADIITERGADDGNGGGGVVAAT